ncbi:tape measure domain-containing protein [Bifidobacterium margollesii]|uniref:Tape measure domain-containing protein n=1 Tax=Bifidobacterium margollesii TaxID=2020964 RepID=A0A2N5JBP9_9BIFI|nr:tape measure protein [Bifidobacterium margollesii]PLS31633.1 tape measure domain-containing protein [Bifidobacterium margollesii]
MAQDIGTVYVEVAPSGKGFGRKLEGDLGASIDTAAKTGGTSLLDRLGTAFKGVGKLGLGAVTTVTGGLVALAAKGGFDRALNIENAQAKLKGLGHDSKSISGIMDSALASVKGTAFGLGDAATVAASLSASGVKSGTQMTNVLKTVADTAQISGRSLTDIGTIFGSVAARGKLQGDDMLQLMASGVPVLQLLAQHLGKTSAEVSDMVSNGQIDFQTFADAMQQGLGGAAQAAGTTFTGALSNVKAALSRMGETIAAPVLNGLRELFNQAIPLIDGFTAATKPAMQKIGGTIGALLPGIIATIRSFIPVIGQVISSITSIAGAVLPLIATLASQLAPVITQIAAIIGQLMAALAPVIAQLVASLLPVITNIVIAVTNLANAVLPIVMSVIGTVLSLIQALMPVLTMIVTVIASVSSAVMSAVGLISGIVINSVAMVASVVATVVAVVTGLASAIASVFGAIASTVGSAVSSIVSVVSSGFSTVAGAISGAVNAAASVVSGFFATVASVFNRISSVISNAIHSAASALASGFSGMVSSAVSGVGGVISAVSSLPGRIMGFFAGAGSWLVESGRSMIQGLVDGITGAIGGAVSAVSGALGSIRNLFPFSPAKQGPFSGRGWTLYSGRSIIDGLAEGIGDRRGDLVAGVRSTLDAANAEIMRGMRSDGSWPGLSVNANGVLSGMTTASSGVNDRFRQDITINGATDAQLVAAKVMAQTRMALNTGGYR